MDSNAEGVIVPTPKCQVNNTDSLLDECRMITRYLVGQSPPNVLAHRYIEANSILLAGEVSPSDLSIVAFIRRNPWSIPYMDAALGIIRPNSLLRNKILLMVAILEATPQFTDVFTPEALSLPQFLWRATECGISSAAKFLTGCFIYYFAVNAK